MKYAAPQFIETSWTLFNFILKRLKIKVSILKMEIYSTFCHKTFDTGRDTTI